MIKYYNGEMYIIPKEFEEEIRADAIRKFAEWIEQHFNNDSCLYTNCDGYDSFDAEKALAEYEKEQKGETE